MHISIKKRIYWSFSLLVCLFVFSGIITNLTLNKSRKLSERVSMVVEPSLLAMDALERMMLESKMYTTNWVFLRSRHEDKKLLQNIHDSGYESLKARINESSSRWVNRAWADSMRKVVVGMDELLCIEKDIMTSLNKFEDYDDPVIRLEAERKVEDEVLPRTAVLINALSLIHTEGLTIRNKEYDKLEKFSMNIRLFILILGITIILAGFLLSVYMTRVIIAPVNRIRQLINDLGKGIIRKIDYPAGRDEIGKMIHSVNNLSHKLQATATFASEIGNRNFNSHFEPLSNEDTLGKALIAMRNNIKSGVEKLNQAQHIAHLGSLERDIATGNVFLSDEMFNILDIDPATFDYNFQNILNLIHPEYRDAFKKYREKYLKGQQPDDFECKIVTPKGVTKSIIIQSKVVLDSDGKPARIVGIIQDISERKKAEEQIKLSNERYELVIRTTNDMIWDLDLINNTIFRNENYSKVFGTDAGDRNEIGKWIENVHPDDIESINEDIRKKIDDPDAEFWESEFRYFRHNNEMVYLHDRAFIIRDENRKAIRMVGATSDITERKKAEEALSNNELRFRTLTSSAPVGIFQTNLEGKTIYVNETWLEYTGMSFMEAIGDGWIACLHPADREMMVKEWSDKVVKGVEFSSEYRLIDKKGNTRWVMGKAVPIYNKSGALLGHIGTVSDISERKLAIESLQQSEMKYRQIVETAQEGIWMVDENNYTIFVNKKMSQMLEYSQEEMMGKQNYCFKDDDEKQTEAEQIENRKKGISETRDEKFVTKSGKTVWASVSINPVFDDAGMYKGTLAMITDITERKRNEEKLAANQLSLNEAQSIAHVGNWEIELETNSHYWSDEVYKIFGISKGEVEPCEKEFMAFFHPDDLEEAYEKIHEGFRTFQNITFEFRFIRKDGMIRYGYNEWKFKFDKNNNADWLTGIFQDITERKLVIESLRQSEMKYRQIVETAQEGIWMIDENKATTFVNKRISEMLGYSPEEMIGKSLFDFMDEGGRSIAIDSLAKQKKSGSDNLDFKFLTKEGTVVWAYLATSSVLDDDGNYIGGLAMVTDITLRKQQEELLLNSESYLEMKNKELERKNKELEQFAFVASHDLQEPLRTTSSFVELLQQEYLGRLDTRADKYLNYIGQSSDRMQLLITDLLDYSRIGNKQELERVDCNAVMNEVIMDLHAAIKESGAEITTANLPVIHGSRSEMKQLFQNLAINAIKFRKKNTSPMLNISVRKEGGNWQFAFADNGIGIAKAHNERIFIIFQRLHTRSEYKGSGIGLSHCKKIVELHKGKIWLESQLGKGTTFYFTIPINETL